MSCRHKSIVLVGSDETGIREARCTTCRAPLTRRIEGGEYIYVVCDDQDNVEIVHTNQRSMS